LSHETIRSDTNPEFLFVLARMVSWLESLPGAHVEPMRFIKEGRS